MHLKRQKVPKNWPIYRKGTKYVVKPLSNSQKSVPVLVLLRDMLNIVQNRKEAKRVIYSKQILLNNCPVKDEKQGAVLFDTIKIIPSNKNYILDLAETGKIIVREIDDKNGESKISKIVNKKVLKGGKIQLNLSDGRNLISELKCNTNDSILINFENNKIEKHLPLKENSEAIIFSGKHSGKRGIIKNIDMEKQIAEINAGEKVINVLIKQLMVIK